MSWQYNPFTSKLDYFQENILPDVPDVQVFFSTDLPTDEGVVFNPDTPALTNTLYISETTSQVYTYADGVYSTYTSPTPNNTPFYLYGTTVDAGGSKTANITRSGAVDAGNFGTKRNLTNTGASNHNKWFKVFDYATTVNYSGSSFKVQMNEWNTSTGAGKSVTLDVILKRQDPSIYLTVNVESGISDFDLSNLEVLYNSTTKKITFYYRVTTTYTFTNWLMLNMNGGVTFFNTLIGASLSGETSNSFTSKTVSLNKINGVYTLPGTAPAIGQVLGYSAPNTLGWLSGAINYIRRHETTAAYDYLGYAAEGTSESATTWQLTRLTLDSSGTSAVMRATGSWTNRATATYI